MLENSLKQNLAAVFWINSSLFIFNKLNNLHMIVCQSEHLYNYEKCSHWIYYTQLYAYLKFSIMGQQLVRSAGSGYIQLC